jgi:hypothetical protein
MLDLKKNQNLGSRRKNYSTDFRQAMFTQYGRNKDDSIFNQNQNVRKLQSKIPGTLSEQKNEYGQSQGFLIQQSK